mgnify:CR=1 FL=1
MPFEVLPTEDNLIESYSNNSLDRNKYIEQFYKMLTSNSSKFSTISLDGKWGSGKTFFIKHTQLLMSVKLYEERKADFKSIFGKYEGDKYSHIRGVVSNLDKCEVFPFYYDAWENDSDPYPVLSILYSLYKSLDIGSLEDKSIKENLNSILSCLSMSAQFLFGVPDIKGCIKQINNEFKSSRKKELLLPITDHHSIIELIKQLINDVINKSHCKSIVIFVDELDRCNPSYAVRLLEDIKHYFLMDNVNFVFSVNLSELQHMVKMVYGDKFDAFRYLDRFFDIRLNLPAIDQERYLKQEISQSEHIGILDHSILAVSSLFKLELREFYKFSRVILLIAGSDFKSNHFFDSEAHDFVLYILLPLAVGLKFYDIEKFNNFIEGKDPSPLLGIMTIPRMRQLIELIFLGSSVSLENNNEDNIEKLVKDAYQAVFEVKYKNVGKCDFSGDWKSILLSKVCMIQK